MIQPNKKRKKRRHATGGNPEITDSFLNRIESEDKEGKEPNDYILVPKDEDYNNMRYDNLQYIFKNDYHNTKSKRIEDMLITNISITNEQLCKMYYTTPQYIQKIKHNLAKSGKLPQFQRYQGWQEKIGIEFNEESRMIYQTLIECKGQLSNLEIAKILRPKEMSENTNKRVYTDKIVRARKRLTDKGLISRFNKIFESKRKKQYLGQKTRQIRAKHIRYSRYVMTKKTTNR